MHRCGIKVLYYAVMKSIGFLKNCCFNDKNLLATNMGISCTLSIAADMVEQRYEIYGGDLKEWDAKRTTNIGISGLTIGAICHYWYKYLDRRYPGRRISAVMKKIAFDQFICSPMYITTFFLIMAVLEGQSWKDVLQEIEKKGWRLYVTELMVWPPAQFINFYWLSPRYRVFYDNFVSFGYDIYTSKVKYEN